MGVFGKAAKKLHLKSSKSSATGHLKHEYDSQPVSEEEANAPPPDQENSERTGKGPTDRQAQVQSAQKPEMEDKTKRGHTKLVMEHAPKKPAWGGKGLDNNTTYTLHSPQPAEDPSSAIQQDLPGGKAPASASPSTTGDGQPEASHAQQQARNQRAAEVMPAGATQQAPAKRASGKVVPVSFIFKGLGLVWLLLTLVYIQLFKLSILQMILPFLLVGMPIGLGISWLFYYQLGYKKKVSAEVCSLSSQCRSSILTNQAFAPCWQVQAHCTECGSGVPVTSPQQDLVLMPAAEHHHGAKGTCTAYW